jgi:ribosomal protein L1
LQEIFQFTNSKEFSSAAQSDEAATGGIRTIGDLPLPRFVPTQSRQRPAPVQLAEAIRQVKASKRAKFDEAIDLAINLGIDPRRGDQMVRGAVSLPHGTGKSVRVCVFANDEAAEAARAAGADIVGSEDLISEIQQSGGSGLAFDKCVATPDLMPKLGKIARILGPRGLMPNPKLGTVTTNVTEAINSLKKGRVEFRADKGAVVHAAVGRCSFDEEQVYTNIGALAAALLSARPKGVKGSGSGGYLLKASLSSTMGAGVPVSVASLVQAAQVSKHGPGAA